MGEACEASSFIPRRHYDYDGAENMSTERVSAESKSEVLSAQPTTLKSDISTEISSETIDMDARNICCLNPGHCRQATSESASSQKDARFDLNKDMNENGMDDCVPSRHPIHVVAIAGQLSGQPKIPLQFRGLLGWKGTAQTSAFHSIPLAKKTPCSEPKTEPGLLGLDLNAAAASEEDEPQPQPQPREVGPKQPWIDLNCLCDDTDVDLNMNFLSPRKHYLTDIPEAAPNILQPMQRLTPLHHSSRGPYNLCPRGPFPGAVPFPGSVRYAPYPHDHHAIYPALFNPGTIHPAFYTPHLVQIVHEPISGNTPRVFIPDGNIQAYGIQTDRLFQVPEYFTSKGTGGRI